METPLLPPARPGRLLTRPCATCQISTDRLKRGRCDAFYAYWHRYDRERPPHLWHRDYSGR